MVHAVRRNSAGCGFLAAIGVSALAGFAADCRLSGKVFLEDMSELSQGYRILSFLGLGVLLLGVRYVYQRDLLNLARPAHAKPGAGNPDEVTVQDMKKALDNPALGIKVVDVREPDEYEIAKVAGVPLLPLSQIE